jgi:ubiquitin-protein ligase E3 C
MDWPPPPHTAKSNSTTKPICHPKSYYWHRLGYDKGFQLLVEAYARVDSSSEDEKKNEHVQLQQEFLFPLLQYTVPDTVEGTALLSVLALTQNHIQTNTVPSILVVLQKKNISSTSTTMNPTTTATIQGLMTQNTDTILRNVVQFYRSIDNCMEIAAAIQLLRIVLLDNDHGDAFLLLVNRIIRGDDVIRTTKSASKTQNAAADATTSDDSDNDDEYDDDNRVHATTTNVVAKDSKTSYRMTKYELLTIPKLDRLFNNLIVQKAVQWHASTHPPTEKECQLARTVTDPALWLHWGEVLLADESDNIEIQKAQDDFAMLLTTFLQATTGLRPGQNASSSHLLSKLAFSLSFLEKLWILVQRHHQQCQRNDETSIMLHYSLALFSDLFAHNLIAMRDDQFLTNHTNMHVSEARSSILAENVILLIRPLLHQLFWAQPVVKTDFRVFLGNGGQRLTCLAEISTLIVKSTEEQTKAARGRILITGTKLWNSLYERWCRLVRNYPFCSEEIWWFPTMINLMSDSAVARDGITHSNIQNIDIEIDDDSSHSEMDDEDDHIHHAMRSEADVDSDSLADVFSDPKMARILASIPQALPFHRRVKLFDSLLKADKLISQDEEGERRLRLLSMMRGEMDEFLHPRVEIRRDRLYDDSMLQLNGLGSKLRQKIQVSFINQHGAQEAGIDGGGVFREFIDDLIRDAFSVEKSTSHRLFAVTPIETLKVNTNLVPEPILLTHYEFLGRVLGKAVYESILVEPQFCLPFLNQLLGKSNSMEDLKNFDPEYYRNLTKLLTLTEDELDGLGLTFELNAGTCFAGQTVELIPGGRNLHVTKQNVIQYIHLVSHQLLNVQSSRQTRAFLHGFRDLIPASWVRLFSANELQKLISGDDSVQGIDVASLKQVMQYAAGYHPSQPAIQWFWEIVEEMSSEQQHKLLKFMTSCSRQPLLGFGSLELSPCVQQIRLPEDIFATNDEEKIEKVSPLPTSSTCMNLLKLPNYRTKTLMRKKLLAAIESGAGFELT